MNTNHRYFTRINLEGKAQTYTLAELSHTYSIKFEDYVKEHYDIVECPDIDDDIYTLLSIHANDADVAVAYHYIKTIAAFMALSNHHEYIDNPLVMQYVKPHCEESWGADEIFESIQDTLEDYFDLMNYSVHLKDSDTIAGAVLVRHCNHRITNKNTRIFCSFGEWYISKGGKVICSELPRIMVSFLNEYCLWYSQHPEPLPSAQIGL